MRNWLLVVWAISAALSRRQCRRLVVTMKQAIAFLLIAGPASASPIGAPTDAFWNFDFLVIANDGITQNGDSFTELGMEHVSPDHVTSNAEVIGTQGVLNPMLVISGDASVSIPGESFSMGTGRFSHRDTSITFTTVEASISGNPLALAPIASGSDFDRIDIAIPGTLHVAGTWNFGSDAIPFDATAQTQGNSSGDSFHGPSFGFWIGSQPYSDMFTIPGLSSGGVGYSGRLSVRAGAFVPEPSSGALFAAGLLLLAASLRSRARLLDRAAKAACAPATSPR